MTRYSKVFTLLALPAFFAGCNDYNFTPQQPAFEVSPQFVGIDEGTTLQLTATNGGNPVDVDWKSDNTAIATVNSSGLVTAVAPGGPVGIIATLKSDPTKTGASSITINKLQGVSIAKNTAVTVGGETGDQLLYRIFVPAGTTQLTATLSGGSGDIDIFVRRGTPPTNSGTQDTCHSWNAGNGESCTIANPQSGTWYFLIDVFDKAAGASFKVNYTP
ncbi:MAG TPA: pre-peptidase C-terminal domain-containing protein [Gemmatimonadaceae bacterium]